MPLFAVEYNANARPYAQNEVLAAARQIVEEAGGTSSVGYVYRCYGYGFLFTCPWQPINLDLPFFKGQIMVSRKDPYAFL